MPAPELSIVIPVFNEEDNVEPLAREIVEAMDSIARAWEVIFVDDGSTDATAARLHRMRGTMPGVRVLELPATGMNRGNGQSIAMRAGILASRGRYIAGLDGDGQNDPADLPMLLEAIEREGADLVQGDRTANRRDSFIRRTSSGVGRMARRLILGDRVADTGCSLRIMRAELAWALPLEFRGMHRFIPFHARSLGYTVSEHPVGHRPRRSGRTKYGIANRAISAFVDCLAVRWMDTRRRRVGALDQAAEFPEIVVRTRLESVAIDRVEPMGRREELRA